MHHHIKNHNFERKNRQNNTKNNPDSITSAKNEKCIRKLVLVVFNFLQVKDDFMKVHQVLFNGNNVPIHTKGMIFTAFPPVRLYAPSARISPKTTAKPKPQPQNHYWHCWRNHTSTSESLLALVTKPRLNLRITIGLALLAEPHLNLRITIGTVGMQQHQWGEKEKYQLRHSEGEGDDIRATLMARLLILRHMVTRIQISLFMCCCHFINRVVLLSILLKLLRYVKGAAIPTEPCTTL
jgi:hypothetical protein